MLFLAQVCALAALVLEYRYHLLTIASLRWRISRLEAAQSQSNESVDPPLSICLCLCLSFSLHSLTLSEKRGLFWSPGSSALHLQSRNSAEATPRERSAAILLPHPAAQGQLIIRPPPDPPLLSSQHMMTVIVSGNALRLFGDHYRLPDSLANLLGVVASATDIVDSILGLTSSSSGPASREH
jgi:hypothetical protein